MRHFVAPWPQSCNLSQLGQNTGENAFLRGILWDMETISQPSFAAAEHPDSAAGTILYAGDLGEDHPGFADLAYRARRAEIAHIGAEHRRGDAIVHVPYVDEEHEVWRQVTTKINGMFRQYAHSEIVEANERFALPTDHVPQLDEVSSILMPLTDFHYEPVPGLVAPKAFYSTLKDGLFQSTQYIRHASAPFYTPEPDVIHEVAGHGIHLASDRFTRMYRQVGEAVARCQTDDAVVWVSRFFWHTMEFGVVREGSEIKAYGAGILSSVGELEAFGDMDHRAWDPRLMSTRSYDITRYQDVLFIADSMDHLEDEFSALLVDFDDDTPARLS